MMPFSKWPRPYFMSLAIQDAPNTAITYIMLKATYIEYPEWHGPDDTRREERENFVAVDRALVLTSEVEWQSVTWHLAITSSQTNVSQSEHYQGYGGQHEVEPNLGLEQTVLRNCDWNKEMLGTYVRTKLFHNTCLKLLPRTSLDVLLSERCVAYLL